MFDIQWANFQEQLDGIKARIDALEGKGAETPGPLPADVFGWITPLSVTSGANVRKSTHLKAEIAYVLAYGDTREVKSSIPVEASDGRKFVWYILIDNNVVRADVARFSKEKPEPKPRRSSHVMHKIDENG